MMPHLAAVYDGAFFAEWGALNVPYVESARRIASTLVDQFRPKRVVDVGCGCGVYGHWLTQKGVDVVSIDGVQAPPETSFGQTVNVRDLTVPFENIWGGFDFSLCLEVAEHIPEEFAPVFLRNLIQFSDTIVMSAAPEGQGGHHHVNERPKRYWVRALAELGFAYDRPSTGTFQKVFQAEQAPLMWMVQHVSVYRRDALASKKTLPFAINL